MKEMNIQFHKTRPQNPFDDGAKARLHRKPPMAAGKMLYCMDRGYGYRWGTPSFLNSYTYTSATGADADAVLKTALAQSGMGELDAQQLENFKWMMTFISDYPRNTQGV